MQLRMALVLFVLIFMAGCGSSSKSSSSVPGPISGNWQIALLPTGQTFARKQSGFLVQNGNAVTGSLLFLDSPCSGIGSVTGTVDGSSISLASDPTGVQLTLTGALGSNQQSMGGNFTLLQAGCSGTSSAPLAGTWTADLVKPLNGNITGTFISNSKQFPGPYQVTGQITQGANTGISAVPLTGSITVSGYCFPGATITGTISGTALVINLVNTDGTQVGQITATTSLDGTLIMGDYSILAQGPSGTQPCRGGDGGILTFNL